MTRTLIIKELRQHWVAFLLLAILLGIGVLMITWMVVTTERGSIFEALRMFLASFVVIGLLVLCNRLVVHEYQAKTQLFLEALPLTRLRMVIVKFSLGLALIVLLVTVAFAVLLVAAPPSEALTSRFVQIMAARTYAFLMCVYAFFFLMGLMGRYRVAIYLALVIGAAFLNGVLKLEIDRFGPIALLDGQFAYERHQFPTTALTVTLGLAGILAAVTFVLSLIREGSVATLLAEKMSHREKVVVALLVIGFVFACGLYDERKQKKPHDLPDAIVESRDGIAVKVSAGPAQDVVTGRELAKAVWTELTALQEYLGLPELPTIFVVQRRDLDADRYERAKLTGAEGVLVRANFLGQDWNRRDFLNWLIREILIKASHERLKREPRMWVLDGFPLWWAQQRTAAESQTDSQQLVMRAVYGSAAGFSKEDLQSWLRYRERVGADIAAAVAWSGLTVLERNCGEDSCRRFLRAVLRTDVPADARVLWHEWRHPLPQELEQASGEPFDEFLDEWMEDLAETRHSLADELARVPRLQGDLEFEPLSSKTRQVNYRVVAEPELDADRIRLLYTEIYVCDFEIPPEEVECESLSRDDGHSGDLPDTFTRGARLYWTFSATSDQLGCEVISGWRRQEIR